MDSWQIESQRVYYRQEGGITWHNDDDLRANSRHTSCSSYSVDRKARQNSADSISSVPQLLGQWKNELLERAPQIFEQEQARSAEQERIAELERVVGRLTMQLEIAKKASALLNSPHSRNDR